MSRRLLGAGAAVIGGKGSHFRKILILILLISSIPGIIIGSLIYWIGGGRIAKELTLLHQSQIIRRADNINDQLTSLELSISHWSFDPELDNDLMNRDFERDFLNTWNLTKTLLIMQGASPLTMHVQLFVNHSKPILMNPEYSVLTAADSKSYLDLMRQGQSIYWTLAPSGPGSAASVLTLVHKIPAASPNPYGVILFSLDQGKVDSLLKTLTPYNVGESFLMRDDGTVLASAGNSAAATAFDTALKKAVAENRSSSGSFLFDWNREKYTVSYGSFNRIQSDWLYVSAAPINAILAPVIFISRLIWGISFSGLLLAALLAWLASSRIYSPVAKLVRLLTGDRSPVHGMPIRDEFKLIENRWQLLARESLDLQNKLEAQLPHVKEGFLLQLIQGYLYSYSEHDLRERMRHYGWNVDGRRFQVIYFRLTGFANLEGRFRMGDEGLATFAAANVARELAAAKPFETSAVNFHDLTFGLLAFLPEDAQAEGEIEPLCEEIIQSVNRIVRLQVTIAISRSASSITQIPALFEEAKQAIGYRDFENQNQIIDMDHAGEESENVALLYPFALEREVVQALRSGQQEETDRLTEQFLHALSSKGAKEIDVQQGMLHLLGTMLHTIIEAGFNPGRLYKGANLYEQLSALREPNLMHAWLSKMVVAPFIESLEARSDSHAKKIVGQVLTLIQENYMRDISLESCADFTGTNTYYLSKTFKTMVGINFIDYLTELRMEKAKQLLQETELKINDIAEQVGYQHSYFNRIFKKHEGATPGQYRELSRRRA